MIVRQAFLTLFVAQSSSGDFGPGMPVRPVFFGLNLLDSKTAVGPNLIICLGSTPFAPGELYRSRSIPQLVHDQTS